MNKKVISILLISFSLLSCVGIKPAYASNSTSSSNSTNTSIGWRHPSPDEWYYYKSNSKLATGLYSPDKDHTYYFNESNDQLGLMYTWWLEIAPGEKYYFYESGSQIGQMAKGTVKINGINYKFSLEDLY